MTTATSASHKAATPVEDLQGSNESPLHSPTHSVALTEDDNNDNNDNTSPSRNNANSGSPSLSSTASSLSPSSPPQTPLLESNNSTTTSSSAKQPTVPPPLHLHLHQTTQQQTTPQMMVLGKDGSDYRDMLMSPSTAGATKHHKPTHKHNDERSQALLLDDVDDEEQGRGSILADHFEDEHNDSSINANNDSQNKSTSSKFWGYLWSGASSKGVASAESSNSDDYASMEQVEGAAARLSQRQLQEQASTASSALHNSSSRQTHTRSDLDAPLSPSVRYTSEDALSLQRRPQQQSQQRPKAIGGSMHQSILRKLPLPTTREDEIQQECSFLYRPVEEGATTTTNTRNNRRPLRAILDPPPLGVSTLYRDAQDVLAPPAMAQYHAKYQQLNQPYDVDYDDQDDRFHDYNDYAVTPNNSVPHDLNLQVEGQNLSRPAAMGRHERQHSYVTDVANSSSMFYQVNGRVMLRLPRDHVRLLVAPDASVMEPGVLSVIQTRTSPASDSTNNGASSNSNARKQPTFDLEYCLTVPPNLYQQVVADMNQCATTPGHYNQNHSTSGVDLHFYASEHADIRIAIGIMVVILTILGINTLCFGLN